MEACPQNRGLKICRCLRSLLIAGVLLLPATPLAAQSLPPPLVGLGDSLSESVQSGDVNLRTQPVVYLRVLAQQMNVGFPMPWIRSGPSGFVGETERRSRLLPGLAPLNLAVSGATVNSLLNDRADALTPEEIDSETDLVQFPRLGSQIEIAEQLGADLFVCWIGSNDILAAALAFDQLDASQMTPVPEFEADFWEIAQRLRAAGTATVFANIPDVTDIGFLMDRQDLLAFLGSDYGLPEGDLTSLVVMLLIRLGLDDGTLLQDPDYVLDVDEIAQIQNRTDTFNAIIEETAASMGMPVVDINGLFSAIGDSPPIVLGVPLTNRYLGGIFSLDGVHPSNIGHMLAADAYIRKINEHFQTAVPPIDAAMFLNTFLNDPFIDKDGDGRVRGRLVAGLLETLAPLLGLSGDRNDFVPDKYASRISATEKEEVLHRLMAEGADTPQPQQSPNRREIENAFRKAFGLDRLIRWDSSIAGVGPHD